MGRALDRARSPIAPSALGTGTPNNTNFLRGDGQWQTPAAPPSLGVSQTWQNVTGSRSAGVTYTNSTGRPIQLAVYGVVPGGNQSANLAIDGVNVLMIYGDLGSGGRNQIFPIVPNGSTYMIPSGTVIHLWSELR